MPGDVGPKQYRLKSVLEFLEQHLGIVPEAVAPLPKLPAGISRPLSNAVRSIGEWTPLDEIATNRRRGNGASSFPQRDNCSMRG
jgi:hypothetical protein